MFQAMALLTIIMYFEPKYRQKWCCFAVCVRQNCVLWNDWPLYGELLHWAMFIKISNDAMPLVIGLMFRPPNSNTVQFTENFNDILGQVSHMLCYLMGDYNVDLLKHDLHPPTENFLEAKYSSSLVPTIHKPTRKTATIATLIYVFTIKYSINDNIVQGIFATDILEHKIKSLSWVQIQAQSSALQTLTSTFPGHWAFPVRIYPSGCPSQLPGEYTAAHIQFAATAYKSALAGTHLLLGREKQCSVKCLDQGHKEQMHRQSIKPRTWPRSSSRVLLSTTGPTRH